MSVWAVVVAGGSGRRFGGFKQYELLGHRLVVDWAVAAAHTAADGVVLVAPPGRLRAGDEPVDAVVPGGATRSASVRAGLVAVPEGAEIVVVHDAARPLASPALFAAVVAAVRDGADGAVPGLPLTDTVKRVQDGTVVATVDRSELVTVQTPQAFRASVLRQAHSGEGDATDDAALVEAIGGRVTVVAGDPANVKLTSFEDLADAEDRVLGGRTGP
ncbi:MAG TPA: 2-C-methyl-D-erythritol 4-phosphate cytidylyltransferase [Acidimicrobiales bacterium]|nr:2-C-methyl-D-erythritol 4-phosphate cytidylyltransferase [Acidimicrobiales bacterium]